MVRTALVAIVIASMYSISVVEAADSSHSRCLEKAGREISASNQVTVYTVDGRTLRSGNPIVLTHTSALYIRSESAAGLPTGAMIPFRDLDSLSFQRKGAGSWIMSVIGLAIGTIAGGAIGAQANSKLGGHFSFGDFPELEGVFFWRNAGRFGRSCRWCGVGQDIEGYGNDSMPIGAGDNESKLIGDTTIAVSWMTDERPTGPPRSTIWRRKEAETDYAFSM